MAQTKELPKSIVIERERDDADQAFRAKVRRLQNAYTTLKRMEDLPQLPELQKITEAWLSAYIVEQCRTIESTKHLTAVTREQMAEEWNKIKRAASLHVNYIQAFVRENPSANIVYDEQIENYWVTNIPDIVDTKVRRQIPKEAQEHFNRLMAVKEAITELREFEDANDLNPHRLDELFALSEDVTRYAISFTDGVMMTTDPMMKEAKARYGTRPKLFL